MKDVQWLERIVTVAARKVVARAVYALAFGAECGGHFLLRSALALRRW